MEGSDALPVEPPQGDQDRGAPDNAETQREATDETRLRLVGGVPMEHAAELDEVQTIPPARQHHHHKEPKESPVERLMRIGAADLIGGMGD